MGRSGACRCSRVTGRSRRLPHALRHSPRDGSDQSGQCKDPLTGPAFRRPIGARLGAPEDFFMAMPPWLKRSLGRTAKEPAIKPPIHLGNFSNGEFFHEQTPLERKIEKEILRQADDKARKLGMDRRAFLASAMGMTTSLSVLNLAAGWSSDGKRGASGGPADAGGGKDGGFAVPPDATMDCELAEALVDGGR